MRLTLEQIKESMRKTNTLQNPQEIYNLLEEVYKLDPKVIVEVGVWNGGSLKIWDRVLSDVEDSLIIGVDMYDNLKWDINQAESRVVFIKTDTRTDMAASLIDGELGNRKIDFLFLDGDHGYLAVKGDFEKISYLVRPGGLVAFHDLKTEAANVGKFWNEIDLPKKDLSIGGGSQGVGVVWV